VSSRLLSGLLLVLAALPAQALEDPTRPPGLRPVPAAGETARRRAGARWVLQSTLIAPGRRLAMVNRRTVTVGGRVNGARVVAILPASVVLEHQGRRIQLHMSRSRRVHKRASDPGREDLQP